MSHLVGVLRMLLHSLLNVTLKTQHNGLIELSLHIDGKLQEYKHQTFDVLSIQQLAKAGNRDAPENLLSFVIHTVRLICP